MTDRAKSAGWLAGALAILTVMVSSQGLQVMQWLAEELRGLTGLPLFMPVVTAVFVGAVLSAWLPHLAPAEWPRARTLRVTRMLGCASAFAMVLWRYPSAVGFQYALFAMAGSYMVWTMSQNFMYARFPQLKPAALYDDETFCADVRRRALEEGRQAALRDVLAWAERSGDIDAKVLRQVRQELGP